MKRIAAQPGIEARRKEDDEEGEDAGSALIVAALVGDLDDGDMIAAEWMRKDGARTGDAGRPFAEAGAEPLRLGEPFLAETRRSGQEAIPAGILPTVQRQFQGRKIIHAPATIAEEDQTTKNTKGTK